MSEMTSETTDLATCANCLKSYEKDELGSAHMVVKSIEQVSDYDNQRVTVDRNTYRLNICADCFNGDDLGLWALCTETDEWETLREIKY